MQDYGSFSIYPDSIEDLEWIVFCNDDKHTYRNVIEATTNTFSLIESLTTLKFYPRTRTRRQELTKNVDERGYGMSIVESRKFADKLPRSKDYGLLVSIKSATWEIDTAISVFFISGYVLYAMHLHQ